MATGPYSGSASGSMTLTKIPRYATITSFGEKSKTLNTITIQYTADAQLDWAQYMFEGGSWTDLPLNKTITRDKNGNILQDNTTYKIRIRLRRKDSQLWTESNYINVTTYKRATFVSVPNVNIGQQQTVTWDNQSGAETSIKLYQSDHETEIEDFGVMSGTTLTYTATANDIYALTPNSNEYTARYVITTTQNNQTYTSYADFNYIVTNSNPIFNDFDYIDTNTDSTIGTTRLTNDNTVLIQNYSTVKAIVTTSNKATAQNYATMESYKFIVGLQNPITEPYSSSSTVELGTLLATTNVLDLYAIDSRGNTGSPVRKTLELGVKYIEYEDLKITDISATRDNGGAGETVELSISGTFWNNTFGTNASAVTNHIKSITYQYKETSASTWENGTTTITATENNANYSFTGNIRGDLVNGNNGTGFDVSKSFNIKVTVKDELSSKDYILTLGSGQPAISISSDNKVGIGQPYDTQLGGDLQVKQEIMLGGTNIFEKIYPVGSIYMSVNSTNPSTFFGGTWVEWGSGRVPVGINTNDTDFNTVEQTGGSKEMQSHRHGIAVPWSQSGSVGRGYPIQQASQNYYAYQGGSDQMDTAGTGNSGNLQPYIVCYMWKRTA